MRYRKDCEEASMVLTTMGHILFGMTFLRKHRMTLDISKHLVHFRDISLQLKPSNENYKCKTCILRDAQKNVVSPFQQFILPMCTNEEMSSSQGTIEATPSVNQKAALLITPAIVKLENNTSVIQITNPNNHTYTISPGAVLANFTNLTPNPAKNFNPMPLEQLSLIS